MTGANESHLRRLSGFFNVPRKNIIMVLFTTGRR